MTGGAGFIASNIVDAYIAAGHRVAVVDNLSTGKIGNLNPSAEFFKVDIRSEECTAAIKSFKPDIVNHHAAQVDVRRSVSDPVFDAGINILGMVNVISSGVQSGVKKFIFSSSGGAIYGEQSSFPAKEDHPVNPASPYGLTKKVGEMYLQWFSMTYGIKYIALRYANIYGPRQDPLGEAGVVAIFTGRMMDGKETVINGDGGQTRDFVYVGDVVAANLAALTADYCGPINIGTGIETSINTTFDIISFATGYKLPMKHGPGMPGEQRRSVIDAGLAKKVLGWKFATGFAEGIARTVAFFRGSKSRS